MKKRVLETIKKYNLFEKDSTIVIGVSGGVDSMALLYILANELNDYNLNIIVAHVNHKKREASELDEELVERMANSYGLIYERYILPENTEGINFHSFASNQRYAFFKRIADKYNAEHIVTAHHAEDQLETFIYRFLTSSTVRGLSGIELKGKQERYTIVRPLMDVLKSDIYAYCNDNNILFREDESNKSDIYTRNRIRHNIVPSLIKESESVFQHVGMITRQISEDEAYFDDQVDMLIKNHVKNKDGAYIISRKELTKLPLSLSRRLLKKLIYMLFNFEDMNLKTLHIEQILDLCLNPKPNLKLNLPKNAVCIIAYDNVMLTKQLPVVAFYDYDLKEKEKLFLPTGEYINYEINVDKTLCVGIEGNYKDTVVLDSSDIKFPLRVRLRKNGDRIALTDNKPLKKLKDIFISMKVPKELRNSLPLLVDADDNIIWIPRIVHSKYCIK